MSPVAAVGTRRRRARRIVRAVALVLAAALLAMLAFAAVEVLRARGDAQAGQRALLAARDRLAHGRPRAARRELRAARRSFERARGHARSLDRLLGPLGHPAVLEDQVRAIDTLATAGQLVARGGARVAGAVGAAGSAGGSSPDIVHELRRLRRVSALALTDLDAAGARVRWLDGLTLAGPLRGAATTSRRDLARVRRRAAADIGALDASLTFLGAHGPRRYLILAQNPAELRPGGGFIGTYGVLVVARGRPRLERYRSIESWSHAHPRASVAAARAPRVFSLATPPSRQTLANVNVTPDWPASARLAARLWRRGGERHLDGVLTFTPDLVARALRVLGPVRPRGYARAVTSANVIATLDHYTHHVRYARDADRKRFVAALAMALTRRLTAGSVRWAALTRALAAGLDAREAMAWSRDADVERALARRGWDGRLPATRGDFLSDAEFGGPSKSGRELERRFDHVVTLHADGSARVATTITIKNANRAGYPYQSYVTLYGPAGGVMAPGSDPPTAPQPAIAGHPATAWIRTAPPWGTTTLRVAWDVPRLLVRRRDGALVYRLLWMRVAAHDRDELRLRVTPPPGWRWAGARPPRSHRLLRDLRGAWSLTR